MSRLWFAGIDQSYSGFAVCFLASDGETISHRKAFDPAKYGKGVTRNMSVAAWLVKLFNDNFVSHGVNVNHVCMEGYAAGAKFGREQAGELGATVKRVLFDQYSGQFPTIVSPTGLKKFVTGKGSGVKKNEMLLQVYKRWEAEFTDDNDADAYSLARFAEGVWNYRLRENGEGYTKFQLEALDAVTPYTERF